MVALLLGNQRFPGDRAKLFFGETLGSGGADNYRAHFFASEATNSLQFYEYVLNFVLRISMYEHRTKKLLSRAEFTKRVMLHVRLALAVVAVVLGIGVVGYHYLANEGWIDALLNASMILGGMGPVSPLETDGAKIFASFYALFCGLVFIGVASLLVAPFAHRVLHSLHIEDE